MTKGNDGSIRRNVDDWLQFGEDLGNCRNIQSEKFCNARGWKGLKKECDSPQDVEEVREILGPCQEQGINGIDCFKEQSLSNHYSRL